MWGCCRRSILRNTVNEESNIESAEEEYFVCHICSLTYLSKVWGEEGSQNYWVFPPDIVHIFVLLLVAGGCAGPDKRQFVFWT